MHLRAEEGSEGHLATETVLIGELATDHAGVRGFLKVDVRVFALVALVHQLPGLLLGVEAVHVVQLLSLMKRLASENDDFVVMGCQQHAMA